MALAELHADVLAAAFDPGAFGEPVALPGGASAMGVFDPMGQTPGGWGSEVALAGPRSLQPNPTLALRTGDTAALGAGAVVEVRARAYTVVRVDDDGQGMAMVELMPVGASAADGFSRYR